MSSTLPIIVIDETLRQFADEADAQANQLTGMTGAVVALLSPPGRFDLNVRRCKAAGARELIRLPDNIKPGRLRQTVASIDVTRTVTKVPSAQVGEREPSMSLLRAAKSIAQAITPNVLGDLWPIVQTMGRATTAAPEFIASAIMGYTGGILCGRYAASPWPTFIQPPNTYQVLVGHSGDGKSPAIGAVRAPLARIARELFEQHKMAKMADPNTPPPPVARLSTSDATIEAIWQILAGQGGRGITLDPDELTALMARVGAYSNAGQNAIGPFLAAYEAQPYSIDRVGFKGDTRFLDAFGLSMVVGAQPSVTADLLRPDSFLNTVGFSQRLDFWMPDPVSGNPGVPDVTPNLDAPLEAMFRRMVQWRLQAMPCEVLKFTRPAAEHFAQWRHATLEANRQRAAQGSTPDSFVGKLPGRVVRYALLLTLTDAALADQDPGDIALKTVERAINLVEALITHRRRVAMASRPLGPAVVAAELGRFIMARGLMVLNTYELRASNAVPGLNTPAALRRALLELQAANWLAAGTALPTRDDDPMPAVVNLNPLLRKMA
jgi:hypothetical protein